MAALPGAARPWLLVITIALQVALALAVQGIDTFPELDFTSAHLTAPSVRHSSAFLPADVDGDGREDILAVSGVSTIVSDLIWMRGNGLGNYSAPIVCRQVRSPPYVSLAFAVDITNDGAVDYVYPVSSGTPNLLYALQGYNNGSFSEPFVVLPGVDLHLPEYSITVGDLDAAGGPDLVFISIVSSVRCLSYCLTFGIDPLAENTSLVLNCSLVDGTQTMDAVALGDMNGDGLDDVVSMLYVSGVQTVMWFANDAVPLARFTVNTTFATSGQFFQAMYGFAVAEVNNAPGLDVVLSQASYTVVLVNDGSGASSTLVSVPAPPGLHFTVADLYATGVSVVYFARSAVDQSLVCGFSPTMACSDPGNVETARTPVRTFVTDVNLDGVIDFAVSAVSGSTRMFAARIAASPAQSYWFPVLRVPLASPDIVALLDANRDGCLDAVVGCLRDSGLVAVLAGNCTALFAPPMFVDISFANFFVSSNTRANMVTADVNGDALPDIVVPGHTSIFWAQNTYTNATGAGKVSFAPFNSIVVTSPAPTPYMLSQPSMTVCAFDSNAYADFVVTTGSFPYIRILGVVALGTSQMTMVDLVAVTLGAAVDSAVGGDVDGDGDMDVVFARSTFGSPSSWTASWVRNNNGAFTSTLQIATHTSMAYNVENVYPALGDLDGDGKVDIVLGPDQMGLYPVFVLPGRGGGLFAPFVVACAECTSAMTTDVDGDGTVDLVVQPYVDYNTPYTNYALLRANVTWNGTEFLWAFVRQDIAGQVGREAIARFAASAAAPALDSLLLAASTDLDMLSVARPAFCRGLPRDPRGPLAAVSGVAGQVFSLPCDTGYVASAPNSTCLASGRWTPYPVCVPTPGCAPALSALYLAQSVAAAGTTVTVQFNTSAWCGQPIAVAFTVNGLSQPLSLLTGPMFAPPPALPARYTASFRLPTLPGPVACALRLGADAAATPFSATVLSGPAASVTFVDWESVYEVGPLLLRVRSFDEFGNGESFGAITVTVERSSVPFASIVTQTADGYLISTRAPILGLYSITIAFSGYPSQSRTIRATQTCAPGMHVNPAPTGTLDACVPCELDRYSNSTTATECTGCPSLSSTHGRSGARFVTECSCEVDAFSLKGNGSACTACPSAATCAGGDASPKAIAGFNEVAGGVFATCPRPEACKAGGACSPGHKGYLCKDCAPGYYADQSGACLKCPAGSVVLAVLYYLVIIVAGIVFAVATTVLASHRANESAPTAVVSAAAVRTRTVPPSLSMIISAFQIAGVVSVADLSWPSNTQRALNVFNVFSLDTSLFSTGCATESDGSKFASNYILALLSPLLFILIVIVTALLIRVVRPLVPALKRLSIVPIGPLLLSALFAVGPLIYLPLARTTLSLFNCRKLPGSPRFFVVSDLGFPCFESVWRGLLVLGLIGIGLYIVGIPLAIILTLRRVRGRLFTDMSVVRRYGSLYKLVRRPMYLLPAMLLGKKLAIAVCSLFLSRYQEYQVAMLLLIVLGGGMAQSKLKPYYFPIYERLDFAFTIMLAILLVCGMLTYSGRGKSNAQQSSRFVTTCVSFTIAALLLSAAGFLFLDVHQIRAQRKKRGSDTTGEDTVHERRIRAFLAENLRDVDDPEAFMAALYPARARAWGADGVAGDRTGDRTGDLVADGVPLVDIVPVAAAAAAPVALPAPAPAPAALETKPDRLVDSKPESKPDNKPDSKPGAEAKAASTPSSSGSSSGSDSSSS